MVDIAHANAYSEVLEILKYISKEDYNKIPKEKIEVFEKCANKEWKFDYNPYITLDEQNVSEITKTVIAILFRDYWATDNQREKIIARQNYERKRIEEVKKEKYNYDDLFKKKINKEQENECDSKLLVEVKRESFYRRVVNFIKNILHI